MQSDSCERDLMMMMDVCLCLESITASLYIEPMDLERIYRLYDPLSHMV